MVRILCLLCAIFSPVLTVIADVDFESEIQPILAEKCTLCHGPDDRKGGLRLTGIDFASTQLKSGETAIVPGDPANSHLLERINSTDEDEIMPPPGKAEPLTSQEKAKLRQWIAEGASWPKHWAYRELASFDPSTLKNRNQSPIDHFITTKLAENGIDPSPVADEITLIRRLYYDLLGLPPTPEQIAEHAPAILQNRRTGIARLADHLLESPHFGERWGRHWLDYARYADSDGYEKDRNRPNAWRYRDWVIEAINRDLPFDRFTIEQFAGDLLPGPDEMQLLATAFNRQTLTNTEGGTDKEQWRVAAVMDRVETLGTVWLGLTVSCARCHTHKYDEITQQEYYELFAYFNNGDETTRKISSNRAALDRWKSQLGKYQGDLEKLEARLNAEKERLLPEVPGMVEATRAHLAAAKAESESRFTLLEAAKVTGPKGVKFSRQEADGSILVEGTNVASGTYTVEGAIAPGSRITGLRIEVLPDPSLPSDGPGRAEHGNFVLNHVTLAISGKPPAFADARADYSQGGWPDVHVLDAKSGSGKNGNGWAIGGQIGKPHHIDLGLAYPMETVEETPYKLELIQNYGSSHLIGKFRIRLITTPTDLSIPRELREYLSNQPGTLDDRTLLNRFYSKTHPSLVALNHQIESLKAREPKKPVLDVRVLTERTRDRRDTHILRRGEFREPLDRVTGGTLSTLPPIHHRGETGDRLDLAVWLVSGQNPLPPRVIVNRIWGHLFGEGIVATVDDFGVRGERPSHPELLDWLAAEFIRLGWSRKQLIRTIVMSDAYQRSSVHREDLVEIDPKNRLLARQNRFRVEAEIVRDISLSASGLLSAKVGGPSVFPLIPPGVTDANYNSAFKWTVSPGEDRYRRGLYTFFKRTAPHPNLMTFDCPDSNVTNVKRTRSNTPLAALITLNNATFTEATRALARRVLAEKPGGDDAARLSHAFELCISREPESSESERLLALLAESREWYRSNNGAASTYAGKGLPEGASAEEIASWMATVRVILNLDEFITRG